MINGGDMAVKKYILLVIASMLFCAWLPGCAGPKQELSVGVLPDVDSIPIIIAQQKGYFESEGLTIKIEKFTSAMERDSALQAGAIDGAVSDILSAAFFKQGGFSVSITSMTNGSYKLLASGGINDINNLKGKSIAISSNTIIEYATDRMLSEYGLSPGDVSKTAIPKIPLRLEMLKSGQVDAAPLPEPLASSAVKSGAIILDSTDSLGINPGVMLFSRSAIDNKSDAIKAFYRAYDKAVEYLKTARLSDYIDVLISEAGFPEDIADVLALPEYTPAALPPQNDFDVVIDWLLDKELIETGYSYEELIDTKFIG
jgi:NitT/TauT family transport system substrate-binding protein